MKRITLLPVLVLFLSIPVVLAQPWRQSDEEAKENKDLIQAQKMVQTLQNIYARYVDTVNMEQLVESGIVGILSHLDPHSVYVDKEELKQDNEAFSGNFDGIGVEFNVLQDTIIVVNTIPGGPSEMVGLMPGDRIISVNGENVVGKKMNDVPKILRGPKGTEVNAEIVRRGFDDILKFKIIRDKIPMNSLDVAYLIDDNVGYIKLNRFSATTNSELQQALNDMKGVGNLILDLRGNGGGLLDQSVAVTSNFLEPNKLITYTEGRTMERMDLKSRSSGEGPLFTTGNLVILVDENSASASEIVAGAIQDWDRGMIVGRRTFGKGLVQQQIPLIDGSAIRLTTAHYYTPSGRSIQKPYTAGHDQEYYHDIIDRYSSGELTSDKKVVDSTLVYKTLVKGRDVYGGGGITPDFIVPADTSANYVYWNKLSRGGIILEFVITELDKHRADYLAKYPDFDSFNRNFEVSDELFAELVALGKKRDLTPEPGDIENSKKELKNYLKALLAGRLWESGDYYKVINSSDKAEISKALEVLSQMSQK